MTAGDVLRLETFTALALLIFCAYQIVGRPLTALALDRIAKALRDRLIDDDDSSAPAESSDAAWSDLGGSSVTSVVGTTPDPSSTEPVFKTLRVETNPLEPKKWLLRLRVALYNTSAHEIAIDDLHVKVYERRMPTVPVGSWVYHSEITVLQDNTIWKDNKTYSLNRGDALEMTLVMQLTRYEDADVPGPVRVIFGLFVDYCILGRSSVERGAIPSDCIYLFEHQLRTHPGADKWITISKLKDDESAIVPVNAAVIAEEEDRHRASSEALAIIKRLTEYFEQHRRSRPVPFP